MPAGQMSWVHALYHGKRPDTGHARFCKTCHPEQPTAAAVAQAVTAGWRLSDVFAGCVLGA
jgi:hypothetical protein